MNKQYKQLVLVFIAVLAVNFLGKRIYQRFDLTKDQRYTLSETTLTMVDKVERSLLITVYLEGDFPAEFKRLQTETKQFLEELEAENNFIKVQFINPDNQRELLVKKGMTPSRLTVEEDGKLSEAIIFPWAELSYGSKTELVSLLPSTVFKTQEEQLQNAIEKLEFSFTNALHSITQDKKAKVAVLAGNGELEDIYMYSLLKEVGKKYRLAKFTLDSVANNPNKTLKDLLNYDLAIIAKPTERFTAEEKFTLDQFISHGKKTLWMLDNNYSDTDSLYNQGSMMAYPRDLNLTDLLFSYGIRVNNKLVQDLYAAKIPLATGNTGNQTQFRHLPWFYHPLVNGNPTHAITRNLAPVRFRFTTQIDTLTSPTIKKTPLYLSSVLTKKVGTPAFVELQSVTKEPTQEEFAAGSQLFAVLLEGKFNSAYKNRIKPFNSPLTKDSSPTNKMVVIADGDLAKNQVLRGKPHDLSVDKWTGELFGNKEFLLNTIDYLLDDTGLIDLRNKTIQLNLLNKQRAYAEKGYWQFFNIVVPIALLSLFGLGFNYWRKRKFTS